MLNTTKNIYLQMKIILKIWWQILKCKQEHFKVTFEGESLIFHLSPSLSPPFFLTPHRIEERNDFFFMVTSLEIIITQWCTPKVHDCLSEGLSITVFFPWTVTTIEYYWFACCMMIQRLDSSEYSCFRTFLSNKLKYDSADDKPQAFSAL